MYIKRNRSEIVRQGCKPLSALAETTTTLNGDVPPFTNFVNE
jgi:hypothetical protein